MHLKTKLLLFGSLALGLILFWNTYAAEPSIIVYKDANCGCCSIWADHLTANGFQVTVHDVDNISYYRQRHGVPAALSSCHTAIVDGYTIEGHVPAADIHALLEERPEARGLAVPGMPLGSPGMDTGPDREPYSVFLFDDTDSHSVYREYLAN